MGVRSIWSRLARPEDNIIKSCVVAVRRSDHNFVCCDLFQMKPPIEKKKKKKKKGNQNEESQIDNQKFQGDLKIQFDSLIVKLENVESLSDAFEQTITKTLDVHAPRYQNVRIRQPWYNSVRILCLLRST